MVSADAEKPAGLARPGLVLALVAVLSLAAFGGCVLNGFVWDDTTLIVHNPWIKDLAHWREYFTRPEAISGEHFIARTWRPLQTLSLAIDYAVWGGRPGGMHATSLVLHILTAFAVFLAFRRVVGAQPAGVGALLFAVHPAISEAVLCLAARGGQLQALFGLLATWLFMESRRPLDARHLASVALFLISMLAKEPGIALVLMLPALHLLLRAGPQAPSLRQRVLLYAPYAAVAVLYLVFRHGVVGAMTVTGYWGGSLAATLLLQAKVFVEYLRLLVWPFHLQGRYGIDPLQPAPDWAVIGACVLNAALVIGAIAAAFRGGRLRAFAAAVAWFYLSLLPVSNLVPIPGAMLGERFIYFSFAGVLPLLCHLWPWPAGARASRAGLPALAAVLAAFAAMDIARTPVWRSEASYFALLARQEPRDPIVQAMAARTEYEAGRHREAFARLKAVEFAEGPEKYRAAIQFWLGKTCLALGDVPAAYAHLHRTAELDEDRPADLLVALGEAAARMGRLDEAESWLVQATERDPRRDDAWNARGNTAFLAGRRDDAAAFYRKALELNPGNHQARANLGRAAAGP